MGTLILMKCSIFLFESKPHIIIIFHFKTNRQKLEKHHVNGSQTRTEWHPHFKVKKKDKQLFFTLSTEGETADIANKFGDITGQTTDTDKRQAVGEIYVKEGFLNNEHK